MRLSFKLNVEKRLNAKFEPNGTIKIHILNFICIKRVDLTKLIIPKSKKLKMKNQKFVNNVLINKEGRNSLFKIFRSIKIKELNGILKFNFFDPIINSYIITISSAVVPIVINLTDTKVKNKKIKYETGVSSEIMNIKLEGIILLPLAKNISSIFKILFLFMKGGIKDGRKASNRIINDYINDIN